MTIIRDATRVGGGIYAVGGAVTRQTNCARFAFDTPCANTDTPILWRFDGTGATLTALPDIDTNGNAAVTGGAVDITADGQYIASSARVTNAPAAGFSFRAVRVTTNLVPAAAATLNLQTTFSPALNYPTSAQAISSDGTIVYGSGSATGTPQRVIRFDTTGASSLIVPLVCPAISAQCPVADTSNTIPIKATSLDGSVAVGSSFANIALAHKAFRYVHGVGTTAIPQLPGGTSNDAIAVSPDGDLVLVQGRDVNGELYLYRASTNQIQRLGSPNEDLLEAWGPGGRICVSDEHVCVNFRAFAAAMSADGSVVAANFAGGTPANGQYAYVHNQYGWFHLSSALLAYGVDLSDGWSAQSILITGVSPDGTLVYGAAAQNGVLKGFIADFPAGALASFNPTAVPPADKSIVGTWIEPPPPGQIAGQTVVLTAEGAYFHIARLQSANGFVMTGSEHGYYTFDGSTITVTTLFDTNGQEGFSAGNGGRFPISVVGNTLTFLDDPQNTPLQRVVGGPASIAGGWVAGSPTQRNSSFVAVFLESGEMFEATDSPEFGGPGAGHGSYTFAPAISCAPFTHELNIFPDDGGSPDIHNCGTLSSNEREIHALDDDGHSETDLSRVIDPRTPLITSALVAVAPTGAPFTYQITATNNPTTFGAIGLPPGLSFNTNTGLISGPPSVAGTFDIRLEASNTLSTITGRNHLSLTVSEPGPTTITPIPPDEPGGTPPVTIEFENLTSGGEITVVSIDPDADPEAPLPPSGFSLGDDPVYFEIELSEGLEFTGPVTVCFSYEGITFSGFPRLLHYDEELMTWVDITTSVDTANQIICGLTSSFSPFVIAAAALDAKGFHSPVKPVAGDLNTAKGGSTVALKFNVFGEGNTEITDPKDIKNLKFEVSPIPCGGGTPNWGAASATGNAKLRYDTAGGQFVQNWKVPTQPGCYLVRVTGDGLLLSALYSVK